jgi:uncharacterized membrane protein YdjX (TVP38/TMEM64 family)
LRLSASVYADPVPETPAAAAHGRRVTALRIAVLAVVAGAAAILWISGSAPSTDRMERFGDDLGAAAPFVWPPVFALLNFVVPWPVIAGVTGVIFGTAGGTALALAGVLLAACAQFGVARTVAGEALRRRVLERVPRIDAMLERNGFLAIFYSRIVPGVSWGMVNYAAGLARVRLREVLGATATAGAPKVFAYTALGGNLDDLSRPEAVVAVALLVVLAIGGLWVARRQFAAA